MLQLRQLHRHLLARRGARELPPALACAPCSWAWRTSSKGSLEPWLCYYCGECSTDVPARRLTGRDHDEPAPLVDLALRLHRHQPGVLPAPPGRDRLGHRRGPADRLSASPSSACYGRRHPPVQRAERLPARRASSTSSTGCWPAMLLAFLIPNMIRMWWFTIGRETSGPLPHHAPVGRRLPQVRLPVPAALHHPEALRAVRAQAALGGAPRSHAELRDHARADHVLPRVHVVRAERSTGACTCSAIWPASA